MNGKWQTMTLGQLARIFNGNSINENEKKDNYAGAVQGLPYIGTKEVSYENFINYDSGVKIPHEKSANFKLAPANTVFVCAEGGSAGRKIAHSDREVCFGNKLFAICPSAPNFSKFVFYYCLTTSFTQQFKEVMTGIIGGVSLNKFRNISIAIPNPDEQRRIVTVLDEAFAGIATATDNAKKNLQNARELFESTKTSIFGEIKQTEKIVPIEYACTEIFAGGDAPKNNFSSVKTEKYNIPILANAVKDNGLYGYTDFARVLEPSITIAARGSGTGHTEMRQEPFFPIVRLIVLIPDAQKMSIDFFKYAVQDLEILRSGSAIPQLTIPMIKGYSIPLPSLSKQQHIVAQLDNLSTETKRLEAIYQQKLDNLAALKQSILQKAFAGELHTDKLAA